MTIPSWPQSLAAITLFCEDLALDRDFYTRFLATDPFWGDDVSAVFKAGETMINLLHIAAVSDLISPATMAPPGPRAVYTLAVTSVDDQAKRLAAAGIPLLNGPMDRPWGIRSLSVQDPSSHVWELAQPL